MTRTLDGPDVAPDKARGAELVLGWLLVYAASLGILAVLIGLLVLFPQLFVVPLFALSAWLVRECWRDWQRERQQAPR